jgi:hypothetical protein
VEDALLVGIPERHRVDGLKRLGLEVVLVEVDHRRDELLVARREKLALRAAAVEGLAAVLAEHREALARELRLWRGRKGWERAGKGSKR